MGKIVAGKGKSSTSVSIFFHLKNKEKEWEKHQEKIKVWLALSNIYNNLQAALWKHRCSSSREKNKQKSMRRKVPLPKGGWFTIGGSQQCDEDRYCQHPMKTPTESQFEIRGQMPLRSRQIAKNLVIAAAVKQGCVQGQTSESVPNSYGQMRAIVSSGSRPEELTRTWVTTTST